MEEFVEEKQTVNNINYNVYNALNLYNEELGQSYITNGFNPFGEEFVLGEDFITDVLHNNKNAKDFVCPDFIEKGDKKCNKAFENSLTACEALLAEMINKLNNGKLNQEQKAKISKIIAFLQMRIELLKVYISKLKNEKNKLKLYQNLLALNWSLADLMEETYKENCEIFALANKILLLEQNTAKIQAEQENAKLRQQAREIIANNLKAMKMAEETKTSDNPYMQALKEMRENEGNQQKQSEEFKQVKQEQTKVQEERQTQEPINKTDNSKNMQDEFTR